MTISLSVRALSYACNRMNQHQQENNMFLNEVLVHLMQKVAVSSEAHFALLQQRKCDE